MFQISKNNVKMIRGDTGEVELALTLDDGTVVEPDAYSAVFSLKKSIDDIAVIIKKRLLKARLASLIPTQTTCRMGRMCTMCRLN